jgi:glucuronoarabinoxylan endo-1,4-beta-xylanase
VVTCLVLTATATASDAPNVRIDLDRRAQTIQAWGGSSAWFADDYMDFAEDARAAFVDFLWGDVGPGIRLNVHRARVVPTTPLPDADELIDWSDPRLIGQARFLKYVQDRHDPILMLSCWTPPARMKTDGQNLGGRLKPEHYGDFAAYLVAYLIGLEERFGVQVDVLSPQNEPDGKKPWDSCVWTGPELATFVGQHLGPALERNGLDVKLLVAEHTKWQSNLHDAVLADELAEPYVDLVGAHLYHGTHDDPKPFANAVAMGRPVWQTEFYYGDYRFPRGHDIDELERTLRLAEVTHDALVTSRVNGYFFWWLLTTSDKAAEGLLVADVNFDDRDPDVPLTRWRATPRASGFGQFSRFVRPGAVRLQLDDDRPAEGLLVSAYLHDENRTLTVVVINLSDEARGLRLHLPFAVSREVAPYRTDQSLQMAVQPPIRAEPDDLGRFNVKLTARSITTYQFPIP